MQGTGDRDQIDISFVTILLSHLVLVYISPSFILPHELSAFHMFLYSISCPFSCIVISIYYYYYYYYFWIVHMCQNILSHSVTYFIFSYWCLDKLNTVKCVNLSLLIMLLLSCLQNLSYFRS